MDDIKKLQSAYKKCTADSKDCTLSNYTTMVKRIKYFRHDAYQGFAAMAEEVAGLKGDNVEGKKIEDYAKESKTVEGLLKHIKFSQGKQLDTAMELEKLHKCAVSDGASLKKLADQIDKDLKKLGRGTKPDPEIVKLQKQIDSDIKDLKTFVQKFKLIPQDHLDPSKAFDGEINKILKVKPEKSKYHKQTDDKFDQKALKKVEQALKKDMKAVILWSSNAEKFAKQGDTESAEKCIEKGKEVLQKIQDVEAAYSKLQSQWKGKIKESKDSKVILASIKSFEKLKDGAEKKVAAAEAKIEKAAK